MVTISTATILTVVNVCVAAKANSDVAISPRIRKIFFSHVAKFLLVYIPRDKEQSANEDVMSRNTVGLIRSATASTERGACVSRKMSGQSTSSYYCEQADTQARNQTDATPIAIASTARDLDENRRIKEKIDALVEVTAFI
ncbi:PREDICTED: uncharacterized protein LOC106810846, partial [Priapulus caudatus]|uniref:Uncharacterized protein LOC106810846 n=1 Tax=Priapulus caudatus TaxID=37621 RepID=A0ABM1EC78_PRICU